MTTATEARLDRLIASMREAVNGVSEQHRVGADDLGPLLIAMGSTLISDHFGKQHAASVLYAAADERAA